MNGNVFGGYDKPNFQPKNLTSDMWEPITTTNNFSAYTPERPVTPTQNTFGGSRQSKVDKTASQPAGKTTAEKKSPSKKDNRFAHKSTSQKPQQKIKTQSKANNKSTP